VGVSSGGSATQSCAGIASEGAYTPVSAPDDDFRGGLGRAAECRQIGHLRRTGAGLLIKNPAITGVESPVSTKTLPNRYTTDPKARSAAGLCLSLGLFSCFSDLQQALIHFRPDVRLGWQGQLGT
jgi:hypothetical protein